MNILISAAGRRVSLVKAFQKELKSINPDSKVFTVDQFPELSSACRISDGFFTVPKINDEKYIDSLIDLCLSLNIKLIIPTIDTELLKLAKNKKRFLENNIKVVVSSISFINKCRDKRKIHEFFKSKNINIAKEYSKTNYKLPLYIKPYDGSSRVDNYIIKHKKEITKYHLSNKKFMFLEYINHEAFDEYTCDLYFDKNSSLKCVVPRKRIAIRSGEVDKGITLNNQLVDFIKTHLGDIKGAVGCITLQLFLEKQGTKIFGIEINPRFGGGYPLSYLAGANFPKWIIEEYLLNKDIEENFDCWETNLLMIRYDDEVLVHGYNC
jgi:carbamoyl-phosphate synthase large subunit